MPPPAKPEPPAVAAKAEKPAPPEAPSSLASSASSAPKQGLGAWLPAIVAVVVAPAITWAAVQYVLMPRLQKRIVAAAAIDPATGAPAPAGASTEKGNEKPKDGIVTYDGFQNIVVNLSGTMGTRYLKTSFLVGGTSEIKTVFEKSRPQLWDVTLNVLSTLSLADLEEPGSKNVIRERLVSAYNQTLGRKVAEQIYFSDFVVQ
jgi:flagellar protein FliL